MRRPLHIGFPALLALLSLLALRPHAATAGDAAPGGPRPVIGRLLAETAPLSPNTPPVAVTRRSVCPLLTSDGSQASIVGQDGGISTEVNGVAYWVFGDTTLQSGRMIPNTIATSTDRDGSDCVTLTYKQQNGVAAPLLPVSGDPEEATVWPITLIPAVEGRIHFFYASVAGTPSPFALRFIGLASFDTETLEATRVGSPGGESFFPAEFGVNGVSSVVDGEYVYVFLLTGDIFLNEVRLARVLRSDIEDLAGYTYWDRDSGDFVADFFASDPLFAEGLALLPGTVSWNAFLGKWIMVYNGALGAYVSARTADQLWGPWSEPGILFDCRGLYLQGALGTHCYAAAIHPELHSPEGATLYVSVAGERTYRLYLHEVTLGAPVIPASAEGPQTTCPDCTVAGASVEPVAQFYAAAVPGPTLAPIHRWTREGEVQYAAASPGDGFVDEGIAFYARLTPDYSVWSEPVYRWDAPATEGVPATHVYAQVPPGSDYVRGPAAFYAPCLSDADRDGINDCRAAMRLYDPERADTDGDGCADVKEQALGTDPMNPWDFYSVPVPALLAVASPIGVTKDGVVAPKDVQAIKAYAISRARPGTPTYDQDANLNGIADGMEYDRSVYGDGSLGPPDGNITFKDAQKAYAQTRSLRSCE